MPWSKSDFREYQREYRKRNRESLNASRRAVYSENKEAEVLRLRKWRADHPERLREQQIRANTARREKYPQRRKAIQEKLRMLRIEHPEVVKKYNRTAYQRHRLKMIARATKYAKENPQVVAATQAKRRAIKMGASAGDTLVISKWRSEIKSMDWVRCHWCGTKVSGKDVQFDHVVALARGGTETIGNYCTSCRECNQTKQARLLSDWICNGQTFLTL